MSVQTAIAPSTAQRSIHAAALIGATGALLSVATSAPGVPDQLSEAGLR